MPTVASPSRSTPSQQVVAYRSQARKLLKQLRAGEGPAAAAAAERFLRLRSFAARGAEELIAGADRVQLKHALAVIAIEEGAESWLALKARAEASPRVQAAVTARRPDETFLYERRMSSLLNRWFASYDEAKSSLGEGGGFLLPYRNQFFITEAEGILALGLDPEDADWERIGWNWVDPLDLEARARLGVKRAQAIRAEIEAG